MSQNNISLFLAEVEYPSLRVPDLVLDSPDDLLYDASRGRGQGRLRYGGRGRGTLRQLRQLPGEPLLENSKILHG